MREILEPLLEKSLNANFQFSQTIWIFNRYEYDNPTACKERIDGAVYRLTHEHKIKNAKPQSVRILFNLNSVE